MNAHMNLPGFEPKHAQHRRNARLCGLLAEDAATALDRWTLLTMQQSWLALADNEEWLAGRLASDRPGGRGRGRDFEMAVLGFVTSPANKQHLRTVALRAGFPVGARNASAKIAGLSPDSRSWIPGGHWH